MAMEMAVVIEMAMEMQCNGTYRNRNGKNTFTSLDPWHALHSSPQVSTTFWTLVSKESYWPLWWWGWWCWWSRWPWQGWWLAHSDKLAGRQAWIVGEGPTALPELILGRKTLSDPFFLWKMFLGGGNYWFSYSGGQKISYSEKKMIFCPALLFEWGREWCV